MAVNDPISDMLTRIRNAGMARKAEVMMPSTKVLVAIAKILKQEGYIGDYRGRREAPAERAQDLAPVWRGQIAFDPRDSSGSASLACGFTPAKMQFPASRADSDRDRQHPAGRVDGL